MNILENEIEDLVWHGLTNNLNLLQEKGFPCSANTTYVRQFDLGSYGRADIVALTVNDDARCISIEIYELKKDTIEASTFFQAVRYAKAFKYLLSDQPYGVYVNIYLIGKRLDLSGSLCYLTDIFENVNFYTYSIDFAHGLIFSEEYAYSITEPNLVNAERSLLKLIELNRKVQSAVTNQPSSTIEEIADDLPF